MMNIRELISPWPYEESDIRLFEEASSRISSDNAASGKLSELRTLYERGEKLDFRSFLSSLDPIAVSLGIHPDTLSFIMLLLLLDIAEAKYEERGYDRTLYLESFSDLLIKNRENKAVYGIPGFRTPFWFWRFFELTCFRMGRLEAEVIDFPLSSPLVSGGKVINIHIPSGEPLGHAAVLASYRRAAEFFPDVRTQGKVPFYIDSWIVHPSFRSLGKETNISLFASDYTLLSVTEDPRNLDFPRFFGREYDGSPEGLEEDSALKKIVKELLLSGHCLGRGQGLYLFKEELPK